MNTTHKAVLVSGLTAGIVFSAAFVTAWTGPSAVPPNSNVSAPLNVASGIQTKAGGLIINSLGVASTVLVTGNTGAGTASPNTRLQVGDGGDGWTNGLTVYSNYPTVYFRDSDGRGAMIHNNGNLLYFLRGGANPSNPAAGNDWSQYGGVWPFYINLENNDAVFGGNVYGGAFLYNSDRRFKTDIRPLSAGLEELLKLNPVSFTWTINPKKGEADMGFIAQDVEKVLPGIVHTDDKGYKTIDYVKLIPVLLGAIKEQQQRIDLLSQKVDALEARK